MGSGTKLSQFLRDLLPTLLYSLGSQYKAGRLFVRLFFPIFLCFFFSMQSFFFFRKMFLNNRAKVELLYMYLVHKLYRAFVNLLSHAC